MKIKKISSLSALLLLAPLLVFANGDHNDDVPHHEHDGYTQEVFQKALAGQWNPDFLENVIVGDHYQVRFEHGELISGIATQLSFTFSDVFGGGILLEPFLGADVHLIITTVDGSLYQDLHGESSVLGDEHESKRIIKQAQAHGGGNDLEHPTVSFMETFPEAGVYKLIVLFSPEDDTELSLETSLAAEFYVEVQEGTVFQKLFVSDPTVPWWQKPIWWTLFAISLFLMFALSVGVRKYLREM